MTFTAARAAFWKGDLLSTTLKNIAYWVYNIIRSWTSFLKTQWMSWLIIRTPLHMATNLILFSFKISLKITFCSKICQNSHENHEFTIFTMTIMHLIYPPTPSKSYTVVLDFSWDDRNTQEKMEAIAMQKFFFLGGGGGVNNYGLCENGQSRTFLLHSILFQSMIDVSLIN